MRLRHLFFGVLALVPFVPVVPARPAQAAAPPPPRPVTAATPLENRPDIAVLTGADVGTLRISAATSMSRTAAAHLGAITPAVAKQLGRTTYYRPTDIALYAVPVTSRADEIGRSTSFSILAVPLHTHVHADGTVAPPRPAATGLVDPTFSSAWGQEDYFNWEYTNIDDGGVWCPTTTGKLTGQWEWAKLRNVASSSLYDYWGVAQRAVATITGTARGCSNTIDWFVNEMQSRTPRAYGARQSPLSQPEGSCVNVNLSVSATFGGIGVAISQPVQKCERWMIDGALAAQASTWYGVRYDNNGVWNKLQREAASLQIVRVPAGRGLISTRSSTWTWTIDEACAGSPSRRVARRRLLGRRRRSW